MQMLGIDISHWQGDIDFARVKAAGYEFAVIKAGGADAGYYKDSKFERYYADAVAAGLHVGAYYFTGKAFCTAAQGRLEAQKFAELIAGKRFDMPVYADVEAVPTSKGKKAITDAVIAFCEEMEARGYFVGVYASDIAGFQERMDLARLKPYALWVARYNSAGPQYVKKYGMWQYGGSVNYRQSPKVPGVSSSACDQDICYTDYPTVIKGDGLNGWARAQGGTESKPAPEPATEEPSDTIPANPNDHANWDAAGNYFVVEASRGDREHLRRACAERQLPVQNA